MIQLIAFYLFAAVVVVSAGLTILSRNPVHSVLWLILAFFNAAGLMVLVGAEFIAMLLVIVYVGAVAVLFLFVVMMLDIDFAELRAGVMRYAAVGLLLALALVAEIVVAIGAWSAGALELGRRIAPIARQDAQYRGDRHAALHALLVRVRGRGAGAAGGDDRRDRAYPPQSHRRPQAEHQPPDQPALEGCDAQGGERAERQGGGAVITVTHYLVVSAILFTLGVLGIFMNRKNLIVILMAIELILLAVNLNLVAFSHFLGDLVGQIFAMFVLTVAAGEAAIGLAILVIYFRSRGTISVDDVNRMKG